MLQILAELDSEITTKLGIAQIHGSRHIGPFRCRSKAKVLACCGPFALFRCETETKDATAAHFAQGQPATVAQRLYWSMACVWLVSTKAHGLVAAHYRPTRRGAASPSISIGHVRVNPNRQLLPLSHPCATAHPLCSPRLFRHGAAAIFTTLPVSPCGSKSATSLPPFYLEYHRCVQLRLFLLSEYSPSSPSPSNPPAPLLGLAYSCGSCIGIAPHELGCSGR
jgi:hypothetical protein